MKLTESTDCVFIHGKTGQEVEEQTLDVGTEVRDVSETGRVDPEDGVEQYEFLARSGGCWYRYRTWGRPAVA